MTPEEAALARAALPRPSRRSRVQPAVMLPGSAALVAARQIVRETEALIAAEAAHDDAHEAEDGR